MTATSTHSAPVRPPGPRHSLYTVTIGLAAVAVLLQGVWAGMFLRHDGHRDAAHSWITIHARGGEVAIVLCAAATVMAFVKLRDRRDLWIGTAALTALLVVESYLGGLIVDQNKDTLTAIHVPLGMAAMGLAVWLPLRATHAGPASVHRPRGGGRAPAGRPL